MRSFIFDAGHGKDTAGKRSPEWDKGVLYEWEFNRDMLRRVRTLLEKHGHTVRDISDPVKDVPLSARVAMANAIYAQDPAAILISFHANAGGGEGFELYTSVGNTRSDRYARVILEEFDNSFKDWKIRKDSTSGKESNFYILKNTKCPAILLELGFMDNKKDYDRLMDPAFRDRMAYSIAIALTKISLL